MWKGIWNLQVPQKVKHMLWSAANEVIPTLYNLMCRNVVKSTYCPNCKDACEDTICALWGCQMLVVIWGANEELKRLIKYKFHAFADFLELVFLMKDRIDVNLLAITLWLIWNKRTNDRVGSTFLDFHLIQAKVEILFQDFQ